MIGSGNCEISATNNPEATVVGSGALKHKGKTKNVTKKIYGSGTVERGCLLINCKHIWRHLFDGGFVI